MVFKEKQKYSQPLKYNIYVIIKRLYNIAPKKINRVFLN
jgi:hypothetical protein